MAKAKNTKVKITTSIKINKLKIELPDANKEIEVSRVTIRKLREEKKKLEKELVG